MLSDWSGVARYGMVMVEPNEEVGVIETSGADIETSTWDSSMSLGYISPEDTLNKKPNYDNIELEYLLNQLIN